LAIQKSEVEKSKIFAALNTTGVIKLSRDLGAISGEPIDDTLLNVSHNR
jgi:hypothetical protein